MLPTHAPISTPLHARTASSAVDVLTDVLQAERKLLDDLVAVMRRQRAAVAHDDLQSLDDSVFATYRVLATLGEARRRRRSVNRMLGEADDLNVNDIEEVLGSRVTPAVISARDALQQAALALSHEVDMNKTVLDEAMQRGKEYVGKLIGAPLSSAPKPAFAGGYGAGSTATAGAAFVNRSV
jgi:hypothetical protein